MPTYSPVVMDHFQNPRNVSEIKDTKPPFCKACGMVITRCLNCGEVVGNKKAKKCPECGELLK